MRLLPERQIWLEHALQGLAFWIGHRHSYFNAYPLTEGALIGEACNLIQANLPNHLCLLPECMYRNLVEPGVVIPNVTPQARADLAICGDTARSTQRTNVASHVKFVIEVKRGSATEKEINSDLKRLSGFLQASNNSARALLFVICESRAHPRFVRDGKSIVGSQPVPGTSSHYRVRRTVKAAASFSGKETAHFVNLIEVLK